MPRAARAPPIADALKSQGEKDLKLGFHEVFSQLCDDLGLTRLWPQNQRGAERVFWQLVLARLAAPGKSKRHLAAELSEQGVNLPLERIYRMMDRVNQHRRSWLLRHLDGTAHGVRISLFLANSPPAPGLSAGSCSCGRGFACRFLQLHLAPKPCGSANVDSIISFGIFHPLETAYIGGTSGNFQNRRGVRHWGDNRPPIM